MDDFTAIFSSPQATQVFFVGALVFLLVYLAGFLTMDAWLQQAPRTSRRRPFTRHGIPALCAALVAVTVSSGLYKARSDAAPAAVPRVSVSPERIHQSTDAAALPVIDVREVFSGP